MLDESTGVRTARAARRLREERIAWLTTAPPRGMPQPVPVWFLWDDDASVLLYSQPDTPKLRNIAENPRVSLHLDGNGRGGDIVVCVSARRDFPTTPADLVADYVEKYAEPIERNRWMPESFAADYSVPLRITISRIRGH